MWSSNENGLNGGFMPNASPAKKARINSQNILPCTVAQLLAHDSLQEGITIGNIESHSFQLVGQVRSVKETPTNVVYELDDKTGVIEIKQWLDKDESEDNAHNTNKLKDNFPVDSYVKVIGSLRTFNGVKSILAFKIFLVPDPNEITCHMTYTKFAHAKLAQLAKSSHNSLGSHATRNNGIGGPDSQELMEDSLANNAFTQGYASGLNHVAQQILKHISMCQTEEGFTVMMIKKSLPNLPIEQIKKEVEFLSNEGHIFCTIDDYHYKATDSAF